MTCLKKNKLKDTFFMSYHARAQAWSLEVQPWRILLPGASENRFEITLTGCRSRFGGILQVPVIRWLKGSDPGPHKQDSLRITCRVAFLT